MAEPLIKILIKPHGTHCNSWGYELFSHAAVLWHHTAALRCWAAALRCHTTAQRRHNTPWNFAEALSLSHCLLHKLCDCCTAVRQTDNCRHKRRALCANPLHKIIHTPGYVRFRIVQPKQSLGHRIDLKLITKIYVNNGITLDCLWGRKGRASIFGHNYIRSGHCFRIPSHGYSIWVWRGHKYLSRRASVVLSSDCC